MNSLIDSNSIRTDISAASLAKTGSFLVPLPAGEVANVIKFSLSLFQDMFSSGNSTAATTWNVLMDIPNQKIISKSIYSAINLNHTSPFLVAPGAADNIDCIMESSQSMSNSVLSVTDGGSTSRIDSISQVADDVEIAYTLNSAAAFKKGGIAISSVVVVG